jgi:hypothetical protein
VAEARSPLKWIKARRNDAAAAVLLAMVFGILYFTLDNGADGEPSSVVQFIRDLAPNVVVGCAAYLLVNYLLFKDDLENSASFLERMVQRIKEVVGSGHGVLDTADSPFRVPWQEHVSRTKRIRVYGRYLDRWAEQHQAEIVDLLSRDGEFLLYLPDPNDEASLSVMAADSFASANYTSDELVARLQKRITDTVTLLGRAFERADKEYRKRNSSGLPAERMQLKVVSRPLVYWVMMFDERVAVTAPYEHWPSPDLRHYVSVVDLAATPKMLEFLEHEFEHFEREARSISSPSPPTGKTAVQQAADEKPPRKAPAESGETPSKRRSRDRTGARPRKTKPSPPEETE